MKTYRISLVLNQKIEAEDEDEALQTFWNDLLDAKDYEELADIEEI